MYFCLEDKIYARLTCSKIFPYGHFFFGLCLLAIWQTILFVSCTSTQQKPLQIDGIGHVLPLCLCPSCFTVMILGVTILRKKYPMAKYLCVFLIVTGVALFLYKPNKGSSASDEHTFGFGEMLLVGLCLNLFRSLPCLTFLVLCVKMIWCACFFDRSCSLWLWMGWQV